MTHSKPRLVLFDAVGTLLHPRPSVATAYRQVGQQYGSRQDEDSIRSRFREALARDAGRLVQPAAESRRAGQAPIWPATSEGDERRRWLRIVAHVFEDVPQHVQAIFEQLWEHFAAGEHWQLDPQLAAVWRQLESRGYELGIASNFDARLLTVCRAHPPLDHSRHVYYSSQLGFAKPDSRFYAAIERRTGRRGAEILIVGDDPLHDWQAPRQFGWQALLLDPAAATAAESRITGLADLVSLL